MLSLRWRLLGCRKYKRPGLLWESNVGVEILCGESKSGENPASPLWEGDLLDS